MTPQPGLTERLLGPCSPFGASTRNSMTEQALGVPRNTVTAAGGAPCTPLRARQKSRNLCQTPEPPWGGERHAPFRFQQQSPLGYL